MEVSVTLCVAVTSLLVTSYCLGMMVLDLTYPLKEGAAVAWPIYKPYNFTILQRGMEAANNHWY
jgi:hypothetical protein